MVLLFLLALGCLGASISVAGASVTSASAIDSTLHADSTVARADSTSTPAGVAVAPVVAAPVAQAPAPTSTPAPAAAPAASKSAPNDRIYYGASVVVSFGSTTRFGIFPMVGYKLTPKLSGGVEVGYEYVGYSNQTTHNYGASVFGNYRVGKNLYAHAEYQEINYEIFQSNNSSSREWVPALLLGGGYVKSLGGRTSVYAEVLFDVLQDSKSPYDDWEPVVNFGVAVGF
jgi:hypothetical protein